MSAGEDLGWPMCEGFTNNTDFPACSNDLYDDPVFTYGHDDTTYTASGVGEGSALIGGVVYRATGGFPQAYDGVYFFADFVSWWIKYLEFDVEGKVVGVHDFADAREVISMTVDGKGSLWYTSFVQSQRGEIHQIRSLGSTRQPTIVHAAADRHSGRPPVDVTFAVKTLAAVNASSDAVDAVWTFGDGTTAHGHTVTHTYNETGIFEAFVAVTGATNSGTAVSSPITIHVGSPPALTILAPQPGCSFASGDHVELSAVAEDEEDGPIAETICWQVQFMHNDHTHPLGDRICQPTAKFTVPHDGHGFGGRTGLRFIAEASDSNGLVTTSTQDCTPQKVTQRFESVPPGLQVVVDSNTRTCPFELDTIVGFHHTVELPSQCRGNVNYGRGEIESFSDNSGMGEIGGDSGGSELTAIVITPDATPVVAVFTESEWPCLPTLPDVGLVLRLDSWDGVGKVDFSDAAVVTWNDKSRGGNDFVTIGGQPLLVESSTVGTPRRFVSFDGTSDRMRTAATANLPLGPNGRTVVMAARFRTAGPAVIGWGECPEHYNASLTPVFDLGVGRVNHHGPETSLTCGAHESPCSYERNIEYTGFTIGVMSAADKETCCAFCRENVLCIHFTYVWGTCYLKRSGKNRRPVDEVMGNAANWWGGTCTKVGPIRSASPLIDQGWMVYTTILASPYGGSQTLQHYLNGKLVSSPVSFQNVATTAGIARIGYTSNGDTVEVEIAEILTYSSPIEKTKREAAERYLFAKHLNGNLDQAIDLYPRTCIEIPQFRSGELTCPGDTVIKAIRFASFGNPKGKCGEYVPGNCHAIDVLAAVAIKCFNTSACAMKAIETYFGNACPGADISEKTLVVEAYCGPERVTDPIEPHELANCYTENNVEYVGGDLTTSTEANIYDCTRICRQTPGCAYFSFLWGRCVLKDSASKRAARDGAMSGGCSWTDEWKPLPTPPPASMAPTPVGYRACYQEANVDYFGNDMSITEEPSADDCLDICRTTDSCLYFTYAWGWCVLKSSDRGRVARIGAMSGRCSLPTTTVPTSAPSQVPTISPTTRQCFEELDVDFDGNDIAISREASATDCLDLCRVNHDCLFYTYVWGWCVLKSSDSGRINRIGASSGGCAKMTTVPPTSGPTVSPITMVPTEVGFRQCYEEQNIDYYGNDKSITAEATKDDCTQVCRDTPGCLFYTFAWGWCVLKSSDSGRVPRTGTVSGGCAPRATFVPTSVPSAAPATPSPTVEGYRQCYEENDVDYDGNDMSITAEATKDDCTQVCRDTPGCLFYTFAWGWCVLKSSDSGRTPRIGTVSGSCDAAGSHVAEELRTGCALVFGTDLYGFDVALGMPAPNVHACGLRCEAHIQCAFFTYAEGKCFLKDSDEGAFLRPIAISGRCIADDAPDSVVETEDDLGTLCAGHACENGAACEAGFGANRTEMGESGDGNDESGSGADADVNRLYTCHCTAGYTGGLCNIFNFSMHHEFDPPINYADNGQSNLDTVVAGPPIPVALTEIASAIIDDAIYLVGAFAGFASWETYKYDLVLNNWSKISPRPHAGNHHLSMVLDGKWYLVGGFYGGSEKKVQVYDPALGSWDMLVDYPGHGHGSFVGHVLGGQLYVCSGLHYEKIEDSSVLDDESANANPADCWRLNVTSNPSNGSGDTRGEWFPVPRLLVGVNHAASGSDGTRLYVFGGRVVTANVLDIGIDDVQMYDPAFAEWSMVTPMPFGRAGMGVAPYINHKFYIMGGESLRGHWKVDEYLTPEGTFDAVFTYSPAADTWSASQVFTLPVGIHGMWPVADIARNRIFVAGGSSTAADSPVADFFAVAANGDSVFPVITDSSGSGDDEDNNEMGSGDAVPLPTVAEPTSSPSISPTSSGPTDSPTVSPTTSAPTAYPTAPPSTSTPSVSPTASPTVAEPTSSPSMSPTASPTLNPIANPTRNPTVGSTGYPTANPTANPTAIPSSSPTSVPTLSNPTGSPTMSPTVSSPTVVPTSMPTSSLPTSLPTAAPITSTPTSFSPSWSPSRSITSSVPSASPTTLPTSSPEVLTTSPTTSTPSSLSISLVATGCNTAGLKAIKIKDDCEAAAVLLGLDDVTVTTNTGSSRRNRPRWCYWDTGRLSLQFNPAGRNLATEARLAICAGVPEVVAAAGSTGPGDAEGISDSNNDWVLQPYFWVAVVVFVGTAIVLARHRQRRWSSDANVYPSMIEEEPMQWEQPLVFSKAGHRRAQQGVRTPVHSESGMSRYSSSGSGSGSLSVSQDCPFKKTEGLAPESHGIRIGTWIREWLAQGP